MRVKFYKYLIDRMLFVDWVLAERVVIIMQWYNAMTESRSKCIYSNYWDIITHGDLGPFPVFDALRSSRERDSQAVSCVAMVTYSNLVQSISMNIHKSWICILSFAGDTTAFIVCKFHLATPLTTESMFWNQQKEKKSFMTKQSNFDVMNSYLKSYPKSVIMFNK